MSLNSKGIFFLEKNDYRNGILRNIQINGNNYLRITQINISTQRNIIPVCTDGTCLNKHVLEPGL